VGREGNSSRRSSEGSPVYLYMGNEVGDKVPGRGVDVLWTKLSYCKCMNLGRKKCLVLNLEHCPSSRA
jgi:hypothetical protein